MEGYETAARQLREAYRGGQIAPLRGHIEPQDGDAAYAIQAINTRYWQDQGRVITGRKIGLTAKAVQAQLGVDQPDFGVLFADMEIPNGGSLGTDQVLQPKIEAEIALVLSTDITDPNPTPEMVAVATKQVFAALEIVDTRIADWKISFADTVADNGSSAFYVLGAARPLAGLDLFSCGMVLEVNGEIASLGAGAACLGHPLNAAAWLAKTLAGLGEPLRSGDLVLTGALGPMVALQPGDSIVATVGGLGPVRMRYEGKK